MGKRRKCNAEQRSERDAADDAIREAGQQMLADPDAAARIVDEVGATTCARLLTYSLRNLAMLFIQAAERGITITDIDGYKGWKLRGRFPNQPGLRINGYKGEEQDDEHGDTVTETVEPIAEQGGHEGEQTKRRARFRMVTVWDISQTSPIEDFPGEPAEPAPVTDPATVLWDNLSAQAERIGYTVTTGDTHAVDSDRATITLTDDRATHQLARALGPLLVDPSARPTCPRERPDDGQDTTADDKPNGPRRVRLDLGEYGPAHASVRVDWSTGRAYYTVTGSRISGTWTVWVGNAADTDRPTSLNVDYGEDDGESYVHRPENRPNRPVINGIRVVGGTHGHDPARVMTLDRRRVVCRRPTGWGGCTPVPDRTNDRMAAVVRAILSDCIASPDLARLHRVAAKTAAPRLRDEQARQAQRLADRIAELEAERASHLEAADRYADIAGDSVQLDMWEAETATQIM